MVAQAEHKIDDPGQEEAIATLVREVVESATPGSKGIGQEGQDLADRASGLDHRAVVEALLPLLSYDEASGVPNLASYVILECKSGVTAEHVDALFDGFRNDGGWLPRAIATVKTSEVAARLAAEFRRDPVVHGQLDYALASMGPLAVPYLMDEIVRADPDTDAMFFEGVRHVLKIMGEQAADAVPRLVALAKNQDVAPALRREAALATSFIGEPAEPAFPRLRALAASEPEVFGDTVDRAIMASGTATAAELLASWIDAGTDEYAIHQIAALGVRARRMAPRVMAWLEHPNWEWRVIAAQTLGAIGAAEARPRLEALLRTERDWRLAFASAGSLAALGEVEALSALDATAGSHWFPIVRQAAASAAAALRRGAATAADDADPEANHYLMVNRNHLTVDAGSIEEIGPSEDRPPNVERFADFAHREPLVAERFIEARDASGSGQLYLIASAGMPDGGRLIGAAAGEWAGGLQYVSPAGEHRVLHTGNTTGIEHWNGETFAAVGMLHMGMNEGLLYKVSCDGGNAAAEPWFVLPGMPLRTWVSGGGQFVVECSGGTLAFSGPEEFEYFGQAAENQAGEE